MPYPSLSPGRAGDVVSRIICWPKVAWRSRLLATALRSDEWLTHAVGSENLDALSV
jgi:hypothetical protein